MSNIDNSQNEVQPDSASESPKLVHETVNHVGIDHDSSSKISGCESESHTTVSKASEDSSSGECPDEKPYHGFDTHEEYLAVRESILEEEVRTHLPHLFLDLMKVDPTRKLFKEAEPALESFEEPTPREKVDMGSSVKNIFNIVVKPINFIKDTGEKAVAFVKAKSEETLDFIKDTSAKAIDFVKDNGIWPASDKEQNRRKDLIIERDQKVSRETEARIKSNVEREVQERCEKEYAAKLSAQQAQFDIEIAYGQQTAEDLKSAQNKMEELELVVTSREQAYKNEIISLQQKLVTIEEKTAKASHDIQEILLQKQAISENYAQQQQISEKYRVELVDKHQDLIESIQREVQEQQKHIHEQQQNILVLEKKEVANKAVINKYVKELHHMKQNNTSLQNALQKSQRYIEEAERNCKTLSENNKRLQANLDKEILQYKSLLSEQSLSNEKNINHRRWSQWLFGSKNTSVVLNENIDPSDDVKSASIDNVKSDSLDNVKSDAKTEPTNNVEVTPQVEMTDSIMTNVQKTDDINKEKENILSVAWRRCQEPMVILMFVSVFVVLISLLFSSGKNKSKLLRRKRFKHRK